MSNHPENDSDDVDSEIKYEPRHVISNNVAF